MASRVVDRAGVLSAEARQHAANVAFARRYTGRPSSRDAARKRVFLSGFGRFPGHDTNATATLVCRLAGVEPPRAIGGDDFDDPAAHVLVADFSMTLPHAGVVDARVVVLPVFWDVAPIVALREIDAFRPDVVMMNGIGRDEQPIVLEQAALNRAAARDDASLRVRGSGREIIVGGPRARRLSCSAEHVVQVAGIELGEAREDNAYLCNQLAYVVEHAMASPEGALRLLHRTPDDEGVELVTGDLRATPRMFVHWPAALSGSRLDSAGDVVRRALDAQLLRGSVGADPG
jgi:pyrrolidone-carboxylate peptidase